MILILGFIIVVIVTWIGLSIDRHFANKPAGKSCGSCGTELPTIARFCRQCGVTTSIGSALIESEQKAQERHDAEMERIAHMPMDATYRIARQREAEERDRMINAVARLKPPKRNQWMDMAEALNHLIK